MSIGVMFLIIGVILIFMFNYSKKISLNKFVRDTEVYGRFLMESDYEFLLHIKYGENVDVSEHFSKRFRDGFVVIIAMIFIFLTDFDIIKLIIAIVAGIVVFKSQYTNLKSYYKANLHKIDVMLPYYLKSLEILVQHYTVPVALRRSIDTAPEIFKAGLNRLVTRIEAGDSTVEPYMDFAKEYPVRDSMRMMRLLYRLGLGSQENKEEQLMMFSRTISSLQNKAREQKYKERLEKMEGKTMVMLFGTGGGILGLLLFAMYTMMGI